MAGAFSTSGVIWRRLATSTTHTLRPWVAITISVAVVGCATSWTATVGRLLLIFAHVSPRSGDLKARLRQAGYRFRSAAENLAEGPTALEAQALTENSPAHRRAMLDPQYTRCGIGLSRAISGEGGADVLLVEVFALDEQ